MYIYIYTTHRAFNDPIGSASAIYRWRVIDQVFISADNCRVKHCILLYDVVHLVLASWRHRRVDRRVHDVASSQ